MNNLRKEINTIDQELIKLFVKRFEVAKGIGEYKSQKGLPIEDLKREQEILEVLALSLEGIESKDYIVNIFSAIFEQSKAYQKDNQEDRS